MGLKVFAYPPPAQHPRYAACLASGRAFCIGRVPGVLWPSILAYGRAIASGFLRLLVAVVMRSA